MSNNTKTSEKKINLSFYMALIGWGLIYTAVVMGVGFYYGGKLQAQAQDQTKQAVEQAVKAIPTPSPK
jgi:uncharacterized protein HemX